MGGLECKEKEAYGISSLHLTTQTAQGSGLCPSCRTPFHSLPLLAAPPQCRCWSCSDRSSLRCLPLGCQSFTGEKSDQMEEDCPQCPKRYQCKIAKRMKLSLSLMTPEPFLCIETGLYILLYLQILCIFHIITHYTDSLVKLVRPWFGVKMQNDSARR